VNSTFIPACSEYVCIHFIGVVNVVLKMFFSPFIPAIVFFANSAEQFIRSFAVVINIVITYFTAFIYSFIKVYLTTLSTTQII
jgi:hypothetical protein